MANLIINLTQHAISPAQRAEGVMIDLLPKDRDFLVELLTFEEMENEDQIRCRARLIANLAYRHLLPFATSTIRAYDGGSIGHRAMVGCEPWLIIPLSEELQRLCIKPVFSFSKRVSKDVISADGVTTKTSEHLHIGFMSSGVR